MHRDDLQPSIAAVTQACRLIPPMDSLARQCAPAISFPRSPENWNFTHALLLELWVLAPCINETVALLDGELLPPAPMA
ncbi:hypothetical protein ACXM2N_07695 [Corynebacterium sp. ZY180755]